ncbi:N-acetylglucosamine-6-phosphate deacetylase [Allorhizocola rhizosphaerae]|uniref:N-acetylglucosamine-6-phosphate deacetylase n=1 Tax=Allorhizocola rhizosphaerae TaxID=1872709 RepID=UPI000E3D240C|nr:N-acetylglucosamine-6-phosphate deacetylase [Allorhizocola rhizosphaerae]
MTSVTGRIVTPKGVVEGRLSVRDGRITTIRKAAGVESQWVLPGFVDIHNHGGGGHTFTTGDPDSARGAAAFHLGHGTTTLLASLVSSPFEVMREAVTAFAPLVADGVIAGVHFEGPYLSHARCGAQNPSYLRDPDRAELAELIKLAEGSLRMVTIAPERPGALDAIAALREHGIVVAIGHTDGTFEQVRSGIAAGATVATHLFNGMRPMLHREPGPIVALLDSPEVVCELVADGVHLHDAVLAFAAHAAGPGRTALITDAIDAAGMPDGEYDLGGQTVVVADRVARLKQGGSIAGSTLTMDAALRQAVGAGLSIVDAAQMAATTPARVLGLDKRTAPGCDADLVVLDDDLHVLRVMRAGAWQ